MRRSALQTTSPPLHRVLLLRHRPKPELQRGRHPKNKKRCEQQRVTHSIFGFAEFAVAGQRLPPRRFPAIAALVPKETIFRNRSQVLAAAANFACRTFPTFSERRRSSEALCNTCGILPGEPARVAAIAAENEDDVCLRGARFRRLLEIRAPGRRWQHAFTSIKFRGGRGTEVRGAWEMTVMDILKERVLT